MARASRPALLALAVVAILLARAAAGTVQLVRSGGSFGPATADLLQGSDEELLARALGADYVPFTVLRDRVPRGSVVTLVGERRSTAAALFFLRAEALLYPTRFRAVSPEDMAAWKPPAEGPRRDQYVMVYEGAERAQLERWLERVETGSSTLLYRLPARPPAQGE